MPVEQASPKVVWRTRMYQMYQRGATTMSRGVILSYFQASPKVVWCTRMYQNVPKRGHYYAACAIFFSQTIASMPGGNTLILKFLKVNLFFSKQDPKISY